MKKAEAFVYHDNKICNKIKRKRFHWPWDGLTHYCSLIPNLGCIVQYWGGVFSHWGCWFSSENMESTWKWWFFRNKLWVVFQRTLSSLWGTHSWCHSSCMVRIKFKNSTFECAWPQNHYLEFGSCGCCGLSVRCSWGSFMSLIHSWFSNFVSHRILREQVSNLGFARGEHHDWEHSQSTCNSNCNIPWWGQNSHRTFERSACYSFLRFIKNEDKLRLNNWL